MGTNVGEMDRLARIVIGLVLAIAGLAAVLEYWGIGVTIGAVLVLIGVILLLTGVTKQCAIYRLIGINTSK